MEFSDFGIVAVPVITVIVFLIAEAVKATPLENKWIPVICGFCGGGLGIAAMFLMQDFPAHDALTAVAVGIVSGLAATGVHQIYKQLTKGEDEPPETEDIPTVLSDDYTGKH